MLWFFNFVQGGWFKSTDATTKDNAVKEMVPNALWWFRFGALWTWISGMYLLWHRADQIGMANLGNSSWTVWILLGSLMGTFMFLNVWLIIWPAQKIIIGRPTDKIWVMQQQRRRGPELLQGQTLFFPSHFFL